MRTRRATSLRAGAATVLVASVTVLMASAALPSRASASPGLPASAKAVPAGFLATSVSFISRSHGYVLGSAPCGKKSCTDVITTTDTGAEWTLAGSIKAAIPHTSLGGSGVTELRFSTRKIGWAFTPDLWHTTDGGAAFTREPVPGGGSYVASLASNATEAFALVSECTFGQYCSKPMSLWRNTSPSGDTWKKVSLSLTYASGSEVTMYGDTVYVLDPVQQASGTPKRLYASTDGGAHFSSRPDPCDAAEQLSLIGVAPSSATDLSLLCEGNAGTGEAEKLAYRSTDTGKTDTAAGELPFDGIAAIMAVSSSGDMVVATSGPAASFIDIDDKHGTKWSEVAVEGTGAGWGDLAFETGSEGWVVYGPISQSFYNVGEIFVTHDGGRHWADVTL